MRIRHGFRESIQYGHANAARTAIWLMACQNHSMSLTERMYKIPRDHQIYMQSQFLRSEALHDLAGMAFIKALALSQGSRALASVELPRGRRVV